MNRWVTTQSHQSDRIFFKGWDPFNSSIKKITKQHMLDFYWTRSAQGVCLRMCECWLHPKYRLPPRLEHPPERFMQITMMEFIVSVDATTHSVISIFPFLSFLLPLSFIFLRENTFYLALISLILSFFSHEWVRVYVLASCVGCVPWELRDKDQTHV